MKNKKQKLTKNKIDILPYEMWNLIISYLTPVEMRCISILNKNIRALYFAAIKCKIRGIFELVFIIMSPQSVLAPKCLVERRWKEIYELLKLSSAKETKITTQQLTTEEDTTQEYIIGDCGGSFFPEPPPKKEPKKKTKEPRKKTIEEYFKDMKTNNEYFNQQVNKRLNSIKDPSSIKEKELLKIYAKIFYILDKQILEISNKGINILCRKDHAKGFEQTSNTSNVISIKKLKKISKFIRKLKITVSTLSPEILNLFKTMKTLSHIHISFIKNNNHIKNNNQDPFLANLRENNNQDPFLANLMRGVLSSFSSEKFITKTELEDLSDQDLLAGDHYKKQVTEKIDSIFKAISKMISRHTLLSFDTSRMRQLDALKKNLKINCIIFNKIARVKSAKDMLYLRTKKPVVETIILEDFITTTTYKEYKKICKISSVKKIIANVKMSIPCFEKLIDDACAYKKIVKINEFTISCKNSQIKKLGEKFKTFVIETIEGYRLKNFNGPIIIVNKEKFTCKAPTCKAPFDAIKFDRLRKILLDEIEKLNLHLTSRNNGSAKTQYNQRVKTI
ncbi:MAG: hypothetical protein PVI75_03955 [Gammaproteobacteria bacterium]|jgi:hypothetical protein